ncbi:hypothetical protein AgCh_038442 [Apium graveolens]
MDFGDGDDLMWHGLACPPLEDYAFNFDNTFTPDNIIDDLLFEIKEKDNNKHIVTKYFKEDQALDKMDGRAKFAVQQPVKDVAVADKKRKADHDFTLEGRFTKKPCPRRYGNHGKGKGLKFLNFSEAEIKAFLGETEEEAVEKNDKKRNFMDCHPRLDHRNQCVVVDKKMTKTADYDSKFKATRQKFHERYQQYGEAKLQRQIQVIDFQKLVKERPRCTANSKGKPSLRQKLMAMGARKTKKKFPSYITLMSCN